MKVWADTTVDIHDGGPLVVAVIVGYNTRHLLGDCLRSLRSITYRPFRVIYVDNDSTDGSLGMVRREFPEVEAIASGGNLGYCGGNNLGIKRALMMGADFILILNADTVTVNPGFVGVLVDELVERPDVGKAGPKIYLHRLGNVQNTILGWPSIAGSIRSILTSWFGGMPVAKSAGVVVPEQVASLNGCCFLVRAEALRSVGLYDARFWGFMDEVEWDWRCDRAGWKRYFVPVESILHLQNPAGYDFAGRANFYMKRNTAFWFAKNGKHPSMAAWMCVTMAVAVARCVLAPLRGASMHEYGRFVGRLGMAYAAILRGLVRGTLNDLDSRDLAVTVRKGP